MQPVEAANIIKCCVALCNFARNGNEDNEENIEQGAVALAEVENGNILNEDALPDARLRQQQILNGFL